jgi:hypothetical protein
MMITARRAIPPRIMAIELPVPVIGRSYSPAFLGWFSAMLYSFTWKGVRTAAYNRQFLCQTFLLPFIKQPRICPIEEGIRDGRGRERMGHSAV